MQFGCIANDQESSLQFSLKALTITSSTQNLSFELTLNQLILWLFHKEIICGFQIGGLKVIGDSFQMLKLKEKLGKYVTYHGINLYYTVERTIYKNKNGETKIYSVVKKCDGRRYACKCYHKEKRSLQLIQSEIRLITSLQEETFVPTIYEVYESKDYIYLIMEYLDQSLDFDFNEDEMKAIVYNLLKVVSSFDGLNIIHNKISNSHIMFDSENHIKLVGLRHFRQTNVTSEDIKTHLLQIAKLYYKYYLQWNIEVNSDCPLLFRLLLNQEEYFLTYNMALQDQHFKSLQDENLFIEIKSMNPKFKANIEESLYDNETNQSYWEIHKISQDIITGKCGRQYQ